MAHQSLFHIQLHPNKDEEAVEYAKNGLALTRAIGLDFEEKNLIKQGLAGKPLSALDYSECGKLWTKRGGAKRLMQLRDLEPGAIGLVRGGRTPVALVAITGPSFYARREGKWGWYRYRFPVQILGWYEADQQRWKSIQMKPPGQGTFQILTSKTDLRRAIERWLQKIGYLAEALQDTSDEDDDGFQEGTLLYRKHRTRERNAKLVKLAKDRAMSRDGCLICEACGFDFGQKYGAVGQNFIECHHLLPVSELKSAQVTKLSDLALLCSNCHRMVHRRRPWLRRNLSRLLTNNIALLKG
jgi:HNH endonuclease